MCRVFSDKRAFPDKNCNYGEENERVVNNQTIPENDVPEHDIYTDPALTREAQDPVAEFLKARWRPILVAVLLVFAVLYIKSSLQESYQRSLSASADAFYKAQDALENLKTAKKALKELEDKTLPTVAAEKEKAEKDREAARTELKSREERMQQTIVILGDSMAPYSKLADLMKALVARESGDVQAIRGALGKYSPDTFGQLKGSDRFISELSLLALGRALLDSPDTEREGKNILVALAKKGEIAGVSAALTISRIAESEQDKKDAQALITDLAARYPEQAAALKE